MDIGAVFCPMSGIMYFPYKATCNTTSGECVGLEVTFRCLLADAILTSFGKGFPGGGTHPFLIRVGPAVKREARVGLVAAELPGRS